MEELQKILEKFEEEFKAAEKMGLIKKEDIIDYHNANKNNLHSKIQYLLIKSGENAGFVSIPEIKIEQPPTTYKNAKKRNQKQYRTDVAFYNKNLELIGISEIFTMDMLAHILTFKELKQYHKTYKANGVTSADKILYLLNSAKFNNILFVFVLPENAIKKPSWNDFNAIVEDSNNLFKIFKPFIEKLELEIKKKKKDIII